MLVHSKARTCAPILEFLTAWEEQTPVVIVPTTYPDWRASEAHRAGVTMIIYANHSLRAAVRSVGQVLRTITQAGASLEVEDQIASVAEIFQLQHLDQWRAFE